MGRGRHPSEKTVFTESKFAAKGMIPIRRNIAVVDEQGNTYEPTYPKRAKGLVRNGRARFLSGDTICLACPPERLEEHMSNTIEEPSVIINETNEAETKTEEKLSMNYVLEQIEKLSSQTEYLGQVIGAIGQLERVDNSGDAAGLEAKAVALGDIVRCRETTNQQLIKLYEKMYHDLREEAYIKEKDSKKSAVVKNFEEVADFLKTLSRDEFEPEAWQAIKDAATAQLCRKF